MQASTPPSGITGSLKRAATVFLVLVVSALAVLIILLGAGALLTSAHAADLTADAYSDDPPAVGVTTIRARHVTELRERIDDIRQRFELAPLAYTDPLIGAGQTVRAIHIEELRSALDEAYAAARLPAPSYTDRPLRPGLSTVRAIHVVELRNAVRSSPVVLTIAFSGPGRGTVTAPGHGACNTNCSFVVNVGTSVTLTAQPDNSSTFALWSGTAECGTSPSCTVTVSAAGTVTAGFLTISGLGPSLVSAEGRRLFLQKRRADGTLESRAPYVIRGIGWSPASRSTNTTTEDPNNTGVRRQEFGNWCHIDVPLMRSMNVNTVRLFIDPGFDSTLGPIGLACLDVLYRYGIMAIMAVDDGINDRERVSRAVDFYKQHPAILMWMLGSEWNINLYFHHATSVLDAAKRTEQAAALIKLLDQNHPVATSYGEIDIPADGMRLSDTTHYVNTVAPSVDVWALNIYRGSSFDDLFTQWAAITGKPMFLGEFGTDAFRTTNSQLQPCPAGVVDEAAQADWDRRLWNHLLLNLSGSAPDRAAVGGAMAFWNDEWWKVAPAGSQQSCGHDKNPDGHPDRISNEEYFGVVDIDRNVREVHNVLTTLLAPDYVPPPRTLSLRAESRGGNPGGFASFSRDGSEFYRRGGGGDGGRGFNVAVIDGRTGAIVDRGQNFDTWGSRLSGSEMTRLIDHVDAIPAGHIVLVAVADEAGLNVDGSCTRFGFPWIESGLAALERLGSATIRDYCFRGSWAMIAIKGLGAIAEELGSAASASVAVTAAQVAQ